MIRFGVPLLLGAAMRRSGRRGTPRAAPAPAAIPCIISLRLSMIDLSVHIPRGDFSIRLLRAAVCGAVKQDYVTSMFEATQLFHSASRIVTTAVISLGYGKRPVSRVPASQKTSATTSDRFCRDVVHEINPLPSVSNSQVTLAAV